MSTTETHLDHAPAQVEAWRLNQLLGAGYTPRAAELLANRVDIDLHTAIKIRKHCPQKLALQILL